MKKKKHILFFIGTMAGGGAERVLLHLLNHLNRNKYRLSVVFSRPGGEFFERIPADVKIYDRTEARRHHWDISDRMLGLSKIIKKAEADLVVAFMTGSGRLLMRARFFLDKKHKTVIRIGENPTSRIRKNKNWFSRNLEMIEVKHFFPAADGIIVSSKGIAEDYNGTWNMKKEKFNVIPNPLDMDEIRTKSKEKISLPFERMEGHKLIVAAGRLVPEKGYADMINVFYKVKKNLPVKLVVLGKGPLRQSLEKQVKTMGLENDICFMGFVENPWPYMKTADLYLSTSHSEGFHQTIAEAMACGTPPVATDCNYGPGEIIDDGVNGLLVPVGDVEGISAAITGLLQDGKEIERISNNARLRAKDFNVANIVNQYESFFDNIMGAE